MRRILIIIGLIISGLVYGEQPKTTDFMTEIINYDIFCCPPHKYNLTRCLVDFDGNVKVLERYAIGIDLSDHKCND